MSVQWGGGNRACRIAQKSPLKFFYESLAIGSIAAAKAFLDFAQPVTSEFMRESHIGGGRGAAAKIFLPAMKIRWNLREFRWNHEE
jgi:hypothetical protein